MRIISPGSGVGLRLQRGDQLRIIDIEGGQTGDLMAFSRDGHERLSSGRSFDYNVELQPDGRLKILPPTCRKGDSMIVRAEMDLAVAVTGFEVLES